MWLPAEGLADDEGFYIEAADGSKVRLDENSSPVTADGRPYLILGDETVPSDEPILNRAGDLADCAYVSQLFQPQGGPAYPFAPGIKPEFDENGIVVSPPELTAAEVPGDVIELADGRLAGECTIIEMLERTSQAHYDFVYNGAEAGSGYGRGGQSHAGMMPAFGGVLPPEYIQAVIDYERGL